MRSGYWISDPVDTTLYSCMSFWFMVAHGYTPIYDVNDPVDPSTDIAFLVQPHDANQTVFHSSTDKTVLYTSQLAARHDTMNINTGVWYLAEFVVEPYRGVQDIKV